MILTDSGGAVLVVVTCQYTVQYQELTWKHGELQMGSEAVMPSQQRCLKKQRLLKWLVQEQRYE